jgi:multiple antibiotic resistance protein
MGERKVQNTGIALTDLLAQAAGILMLYNPPVAAMTYVPLTGHLPAQVRLRISVRMFVWIAVVFLATVWGGQAALRILGVSAAALTMTGGLMLLVFAVPMALGRCADSPGVGERLHEDGRWQQMIAMPLIFPLSIGGGMIALIVGSAARTHSVPALTLMSLVCVVMAAVIGTTHFVAGSLARTMKREHMEICKRVGGILLVAIAIQMLADSAKALLPGLAH